MADRASTLQTIAVGDIFHASAPNGASFISLVLGVTDRTITARRITTQSVHRFDRETGVADADDIPVTIDSVAALPPDIYEVMLGIDRKYGYSASQRRIDPEWIAPAGTMELTEAEKRGLLFIAKFYPSNPL